MPVRIHTAAGTSPTPRVLNAWLGYLVVVSVFLAPLVSAEAAPSPAAHVEGELLVKFRGGPRGEAAAQAQRAFQHKVKRHFDPVGWQHIQLPPGLTVADALAKYQRHPNVLAVEPNYLHRLVAMGGNPGVIPNDPRFTNQWGLLKIGATNAWATTTGSPNVVVAVIDSGVDYNHEDLAPNMWRNPGETGLDGQARDKATNGIDDDGNGYVDDVHGIDVVNDDSDPRDGKFGAYDHGTACAGILGAVGDNGIGIAGVNWSVQLMAVRFLGAASNYVDTVGFVEACCYVLAMKSRGVNVRVTNNSYGFTNNPGEAVRSAVETLGNAGILNVFAAGVQPAGGTDLDVNPIVFPQVYHLPEMINVAASDTNDSLPTIHSNWGATNVDLAAPGVNIATTQAGNLYYASLNGTSFSCPFVAGAAALLAATYPFANAGQIKTALMLTVDVAPGFVGKVVSNGRLNLARAIEHPGLPITAPPFVLAPPQSQTNGLDSSATFQVTATGPSSSPLVFQWQHNGLDLTNATNATLVLSNVGTNDAGDYRVVVANDFGTATSPAATLTVAVCPVILGDPQSIRVVDGTDVSLRVMAAGASPLAFQWQRNGTDIAYATDATLILTNVSPSDSGDYQVVVTNACGSVTSAVAKVTVLGRPLVIAQPRSQTVAVGADVTLCVTVTNTATVPIGCRWVRNRIPSSVAVMSQFAHCTNLSSIQTNLAGTWFALLTNEAPAGITSMSSSNAYVTVVVPPTNQMALAGSDVAFTALAYGTNVSYRWQFNGTDLTNSGRISGVMSTNLTISDVQPTDAGEYTVLVRNAAGDSTPFTARLDVDAPPHALAVRLVPCLDPPSPSCAEICWPDDGGRCILEWTDHLGEPWQPWPGLILNSTGSKCALIPPTGQNMFFRLRCL